MHFINTNRLQHIVAFFIVFGGFAFNPFLSTNHFVKAIPSDALDHLKVELFDTIIDMDDETMFGEEGSSTLKSFILKALSKPTNGAQGQPPISGNNEGRNDYLNQ